MRIFIHSNFQQLLLYFIADEHFFRPDFSALQILLIITFANFAIALNRSSYQSHTKS